MAPFAHLPEHVVNAWPGLSPSAKAVAVAVASYMGKAGKCWPSRRAIGERAGINRLHTVSRALDELRRRGLLAIQRRKQAESVYRWASQEGADSVPPNPARGYTKRTQEGAETVPSNRQEGADSGPPNPPRGYTKRTQEGAETVPSNRQEGADSVPPNPARGYTKRTQEGAETVPRKVNKKELTTIAPELEGLPLYRKDAKLRKRWPELLEAWRQAYPGVDVLAEVRKAHAWETANPSKRKRDRARFLTNWLGRAAKEPQPEAGGPKYDPLERL